MTGEDKKTGKDVPLPDSEIQMIRGIGGVGQQNNDHSSWHNYLKLYKDTGKPNESVTVAKRVLNKKDGKEYCIVVFRLEGTGYDGGPMTINWSNKGVYYLPVWKKLFNGKKNRWEETDICDSQIEVYEYPWEGRKTKIEDLDGKMRPLTEFLREDTQFMIVSNNNHKLNIKASRESDFNKDAWFDLTRDELIAKYDTPPNLTVLDNLTTAITEAQNFKQRMEPK